MIDWKMEEFRQAVRKHNVTFRLRMGAGAVFVFAERGLKSDYLDTTQPTLEAALRAAGIIKADT